MLAALVGVAGCKKKQAPPSETRRGGNRARAQPRS